MRASRTDKGVSAIMNVVSCKLHKYPNMCENEMKEKVNKFLPEDIKVFRIIEVSGHFNSKDNNNLREYHYYIPSFVFERHAKNEKTEEDKREINPQENLSSKIKVDSYFTGNYSYKLPKEDIEKIRELCLEFKGTKNYHNYTRKQQFSDMSSQRIMFEVACEEVRDFGGFEMAKFKIVGQSFLYNQIRKMIGIIVDIIRSDRDFQYLRNSFLSNKILCKKIVSKK